MLTSLITHLKFIVSTMHIYINMINQSEFPEKHSKKHHLHESSIAMLKLSFAKEGK